MKDWLKGPEFVAWVSAMCPDTMAAAKSAGGGQRKGLSIDFAHFGRRVRDWEAGSLINVYTADRYLTAFGLHLSMIPDEVWTDERPFRGNMSGTKGYPPELKERVLSSDKGHAATSREFGISVRTVANWRKKAAA